MVSERKRNRFPEDSDFEVKNKKTFPKISKRLSHLINPLIQIYANGSSFLAK
jgi:hypothetical protein